METVPEGMDIPPELEFKPSGMEADQIGVWSKKAITLDQTYGPFLGVKRKLAEVNDDTYSWEIRGPKGRRLFCIDASDPAQGNWMRFVKSARYYEEQNMIAQQENKNIYYKTLRDIPAGEELLCWYNSGEPPSEEMHNETMLKEAKARAKADKKSAKDNAELKKKAKDSTDKVESKTKTPKSAKDSTEKSESKTNSAKTGRQGAKSSGKDGVGNKAGKSKDKAKVKTEKIKSGKQSKQSSDKTACKSDAKSKPISNDVIAGDKTTKDSKSKTSLDSAGKDNEKHVDEKAATNGDHVQMNEQARLVAPTTLSINEQTGGGCPVFKLTPADTDTPMDADGDGKCVRKHLVMETKLNEDKELLAADGSLKSPDMPILENMTKEGFLIPSPTKHTTSWSSNKTATTKEVIVGGVICHEIAPPKISPVLPITKNQETPVKETVLASNQADDTSDVKDANVPEEKLAIQAPDVSSTEESSGAEREMQDEQDKDSHVTSSRAYTQEGDSVDADAKNADDEVFNKISEDKSSPDPENKNEKSTNVKAVDDVKKVKKSKKRKPVYKCHVCGSVFGKPVHVKIHIAKKHGVQARRSGSKAKKVFVPGKREKIRTRSVATQETTVPDRRAKAINEAPLEKATDQLLTNKSEEQNVKKVEETLTKRSEPDNQVEKDNKAEGNLQESKEEEMQAESSPNEPPDDESTLNDAQFTDHSLLSGSASMIPMMYSSAAYGHREGKNCGTYQCEFCRRVFRYRTWLAKHLELKHPGKTPTVSFKEILKEKEKPKSPIPPAPPVEDEDKLEELTPEQIQILKDNSKGKRLKIFPCSLCNRRFSSKTNVRRHKRLIHKILVRPRRTRLPYPEYTVEEEEKPKRPTVPSNQTKVDTVPSTVPDPELRSDLSPSTAASVSTGMRKPRKNKSPLKRSRAVHSQEDFADSYLTFPIEPNPNPLSAFMPTKPETFELESAVYNQKMPVHRSPIPIKQISEPSLPPPITNPPTEHSLSRRTGLPPAAATGPTDVNNAPHEAKIPELSSKQTSEKPGSTQAAVVSPSSSRRKPSSVKHLHHSVPLIGDRISSSHPPKSSHQKQAVPPSDNPYMSKFSSSSHEAANWGSKSNRQKTVQPSGKIQSESQKPVMPNPWVSGLKPQPFVPKKPKTEIESDDKKEVNQVSFRRETPVTQRLSASHNDPKKLDTFSVLNLKRREPTPPPPPSVSEDGVLDLTVRKKPRIESPVPPPPTCNIPSQPLDENQPLDLSSSSYKSNKGYSHSALPKQPVNPAPNYASSSSKLSSESSNYANAHRYEFHHMSPASFAGKDHFRKSSKKPVQTVQQMLRQQNGSGLLMKVDREKPQQARMQPPLPMQMQHPMQLSKTSTFRPLLPKPSTSTAPVLSPSVPEQRISQKSPTKHVKGTQQLSPHLVAAQVIKQAHAQSALRPILPKPVPGAATPVLIGGKVVAAGSPPRSNKLDAVMKRQSLPDGAPLDSSGFACNVCDVPFTSIKALAKHVVIHAHEWAYKCEFCVRLYQDPEELIQHRTQLHHVGKTFSCGVCKRDFAYKSNLKKHQTDVHNLTEMNYRELGPKELRAHNFTDPARIKTGPPELPPKPERVSFLEQEMKKQTPVTIGKLKLPLKTSSASSSPTRSTPSPRKSGPINPQRHHPFAYARQIGYLNMLNDPRNQEVLQTVTTHRCTKCSKEFAETTEFHGHIMECALQGMEKASGGNKEKEKSIDAEKHAIESEKQAKEASEKKMKMKAYTKSKKKAIQQRQTQEAGKRQRAKPGLKTYNPKKYTRRRSSASVDDVHACPGCDKKFYFINKLERHMRMCPNREKFLKGKKLVVDPPGDNVVKKGHCCPFCSRQFTYLKSLKKHALVCPARNPNEADPIRLIEENFKKAQRQMEVERDSVDSKSSKTAADKGQASKQRKTQNAAAINDGKKKRRRKRRSDVIPRPKKRKRNTGSSDAQEEENETASSSRKARKGVKRNTLLIKMGQITPVNKQEETVVDKKETSATKRQLSLVDQSQRDVEKSGKAANKSSYKDQLDSENMDTDDSQLTQIGETGSNSGNGDSLNNAEQNEFRNIAGSKGSCPSNESNASKENNNEVVKEHNADSCEDKQNATTKDAIAEDAGHPSTTIPNYAGNLPDQSAKKHVAEGLQDQNQIPDKNQNPCEKEIHSIKQISTNTNAVHENGTENVSNGPNEGHESTEMTDYSNSSHKAYPVRNRLQSAS